MLIYKILRAAEWDHLQTNGETAGAPVDLADGFVHFSTAEQLQGTYDKHFSGASGLFLLACDAQAMEADLKWEISRGGAKFPHLYRLLRMADVRWWRPVIRDACGTLITEHQP